jgi:adenylyltransferase/sulfurtransferase
MLTGAQAERYSRHLLLSGFGPEGQEAMMRAKVAVIGAGGLGCPVLQYLAAAGIGHIRVIDQDVVELSNLQRQVLFTGNDVGRSKAEAACERLRALNGEIQVEAVTARIDASNAVELLRDADIVVDGSDNFATRYLVNDACVMLGKPFVSGAIYQYELQVGVFNYKGGATYRCLYPEPGDMPSCSEAGVLGVLPGVAGVLMANEVIKITTQSAGILAGKLLLMDLRTLRSQVFGITADPANREIRTLAPASLACDTAVSEISAEEFLKLNRNEIQVIDVREPDEFGSYNIGGLNIPLNTLAANIEHISRSRLTVVHCASGVRSRRAVQHLVAAGFSRVLSLQNGLRDLQSDGKH